MFRTLPLMKALTGLVLAALAGTVLAADVVTLVNGERLRGEFVSADRSTVELRVDGELRRVPRAEVRRIDFQRQSNINAGLSRSRLVVETGLMLEARLRGPLSSHVSRNGERFEAELLTPITSTSGEVLAKAGDTIWGRVVRAERRRPPATRGVLDVELAEVRMLGRIRTIKTTLGEHDDATAGVDSRETRLQAGQVLRFRLSQPITIRPSRF